MEPELTGVVFCLVLLPVTRCLLCADLDVTGSNSSGSGSRGSSSSSSSGGGGGGGGGLSSS